MAVFVLSYAVFVVTWLNVQEFYGKSVLAIASHVTAKVKHVNFDSIQEKPNRTFGARFYISRGERGFYALFNFDFAQFTYNTPLTFAIIASLALFIRRRVRACTEAFLMLFLLHFFYVFTSEAGRIADMLAKNRLEPASSFTLFLWQYAWGFIDAMFIRFEPFLIGLYLYIRFYPVSLLKKRPD